MFSSLNVSSVTVRNYELRAGGTIKLRLRIVQKAATQCRLMVLYYRLFNTRLKEQYLKMYVTELWYHVLERLGQDRMQLSGARV